MTSSGRRIALVVEPYPDEAPSSWLTRLAALAGASPYRMLEHLGVQEEIDLGLSPRAAEALALATGVALARLASLQPGAALAGFGEADLAPTDPHTGLRGAVCGACLAEDAADGRDHHIRWAWVFGWTTTCWRHGVELTEIESMDALPSRARPGRQIRVGLAYDNVTNRFRIKTLQPGRVVRPASVGLMALEQELAKHRQGERTSDIWGLGRTWPVTRQVLLDLSDFLASRDTASGFPVLTYMYGRDDDSRWGWWNVVAGQPGLALRLDPRRRASLLEALSCVLLDPRRFQIIDLHRYGAAEFFRRFRAERGRPIGALGRMATLDPLTPLLAEASEPALRALERASRRWPRSMATRLGAASAAAM